MKNQILKYSVSIFTGMIIFAFIADRYIFPLPQDSLNKKQAHYVYSREGRLMNSFASEDSFWRRRVTLDEISPKLVNSVLAVEDKWFYYHPGCNPFSLVGALIDNVKAGKVVRGGSTITMQIARMMEPKERSYFNKIIEILRAFQLEWHYSKDELLTIYFNLAPYGGNIEGVGAATQFYFDKTPDKLTQSEAAILTAIPSSPNKYRPDINKESCKRRRDIILSLLNKRNIISEADYNNALLEEIPSRRFERPFVAPHFCQTVISENKNKPAINTTLDYNLQIKTSQMAKTHLETIRYKGINNLAVVVIDNNTMELLVSIGNPDFEDARHEGQVNGTLAFRSPGSALKPFIYALGLEDGLVSPMTKVDDIPVTYGGYSPVNYDKKYNGIVSVADALISSRNVPAVNLTSKVGLNKLYELLKKGGISSLDKKYYEYGLPLVLGACEVNLLELTNLYSTFANNGNYRKVKIYGDESGKEDTKLFSAEVCYIISDILSNLQRPDLFTSWEFTKDLPTVAWKTGTSYGRRDAWAIGYNPNYTVGVWAGNFSGEGSPDLVGVETAAPLMLNIFRELNRNSEIKWFDRPDFVHQREICAVSGMRKNDNCPDVTTENYIYQKSPNELCTVHKRIEIDRKTDYLVCRSCSHNREVDTLIIEQWPAKISGWLKDRKIVTHLPQHDPSCNGLYNDDAPVIISPENGSVYELASGIPLEYQKLLFKASASLKSKKIHWFLNDEYFSASNSGEKLFYSPQKGRHRLLCVDEYGHSSQISFEIR